MGGYSHRYWVCPYFSKDERLKISCEAGIVRFPDRKAITRYADDYCCHMPGWESCSMAAMLNRHYDEQPIMPVSSGKVYFSGGGREIRSNLPQ